MAQKESKNFCFGQARAVMTIASGYWVGVGPTTARLRRKVDVEVWTYDSDLGLLL